MLTWPHADTDWGDVLDRVTPVFAWIGAAISARELLLSVCSSRAHAREVAALLRAAGAVGDNLRFAIADSDDTWARDHGPLTTLSAGAPLLHDFRFNGWGGKFDALRDDRVTACMHASGVFAGAGIAGESLTLEGGAIETDGLGTLLATRSTLISESRNPGLQQADIEAVLQQQLGIRRFLWLDHGDISGDDTDGHIDTLARFVDPTTIVYSMAPPGDVDHAGLAAMEAQLHALRDGEDRPYNLHALPFPGVHVDDDGRRLPATYANFLFVNGAILLPVYGVPQDAEAAALLARLCPRHTVVQIDCREIIRHNGSLHCLTMQFPEGVEIRNLMETAPDED